MDFLFAERAIHPGRDPPERRRLAVMISVRASQQRERLPYMAIKIKLTSCRTSGTSRPTRSVRERRA
jgi:hypothetical protein